MPEVWTDSCVEFFCGHAGLPEENYFNFEFSCIGTCLNHLGPVGAHDGPEAVRHSSGDAVIGTIWRAASLGKGTATSTSFLDTYCTYFPRLLCPCAV